MRLSSTGILVSVLGTACSVAAVSYPFEFQPTDHPLRYDVNVTGDIVVETPMGRMTSETESDATILVDIGGPTADGWNVTATFEALEVRAEGALGGGSVNAEETIGKPYRGVLSRSGQITVTDSPELSGRLTENLDPAAMLTELLVPLPPAGSMPPASWPVTSKVWSDAAVDLTNEFEGTARFAGDTVWNGIPAQVIVAEGTNKVEGSGTPAAAPAEIDIVFELKSTRIYVWDTMRRVMLASLFTGEGDGTVSIRGMNLTIPSTFTMRQEVTLKNQ